MKGYIFIKITADLRNFYLLNFVSSFADKILVILLPANINIADIISLKIAYVKGDHVFRAGMKKELLLCLPAARR
jgi:hypothetical protein